MILLLFDIDGTLMDTGGAGMAALQDAAMDCFQLTREQVPAFDLAGATDLGVVENLLAALGLDWCSTRAEAFRSAYLSALETRLSAKEFRGRLLPGVAELLETLSGDVRFALGLLTGNYRRGAELKLERFGLKEFFAEGAFGDDAADRNLLGPVALGRMRQQAGHKFTAERTIIIGDTPRDIDCAKAVGARCLAVATGAFTQHQLAAHQPWQTLAVLSDTVMVHKLLAEV